MFDPYHKWLGVPTGKRPPTHYQLLAISESEKDRDVIEAATVRQSAYVRNFQKGPHADEATRLLAEISEARAVLTDPARRKTYDDMLAVQRPAPKPVAPAKPAAAVTAQAVVVRAAPVQKPARAPKRKSKSGVSVPVLLGIIAVVASAVGLGVYFATRGNGDNSMASSDKSRDPKATDANKGPVNANPAGPNQANPAPFPWDQQKVERPHPAVNPNPGPPPGFGQPPPGFGQPPKGFGPPPGMFRPPFGSGQPNVNPPNPGNTGKQNPNQKPKDNGLAAPEKKGKSSWDKVDSVDDALERLDGDVFNVDAAAKYLVLIPVDPKRKKDVAKKLNAAIVSDGHQAESLFEAAAKWADDETIKIFSDKLSARPWVGRGVVRATGRIKNSQLALKLCILLENFFEWEEATRALQQMGPVAEPHVRSLLVQHRDPKMRAQACLILASIGTEKSLPSLRKASGEKATKLPATAAIQEINERVKAKKEAEPDEFDEKPPSKS